MGSTSTVEQPVQVMGIVNVTPDSFSDGGQFTSVAHAVEHALLLVSDGAHILDIGGESMRPGAEEAVSEQEELDRVLPVIEGIRSFNASVAISIDTYKASVARAALSAGATMVNDVSAGRFDDSMFALIRERNTPYIMMHMQGMPRTMQVNPVYDDVVREVSEFLQQRKTLLGAVQSSVYVDPGIGFGKTTAHNITLLRNLDALSKIAPVVLGFSRKRFLTDIASIATMEDRDRVTMLLHALLHDAPVAICRVHKVKAFNEAYGVVRALCY